MFTFDITSRLDKIRARTGIFHTPHHDLETPELAIVATEAEIKAIPKNLWSKLPCKLLIVNTFHINKKSKNGKSILDDVQSTSGIHEYMNLNERTIESDSGGFQVFSLGFGKAHNIGKIGGFFPNKDITIKESDTENPLKITDEGVTFTFDGREIHLNPEISMDLQHKIGADIMFAFDECSSPLNSKEYIRSSMQRTHRWLDRCITAHKSHEGKQALFGIVQGGEYEDLRRESAKIVSSKDVSGFGIGGSFGDFKEAMGKTLSWVIDELPDEKPRHLLGIGKIRDIFASVECGVDLFDCVIPTREARHRTLYTKRGRVNIKKMKTVSEAIDKNCQCFACRQKLTYAALWELFAKRDPLSTFYATAHNIWFFADFMKQIRESINNGSYFKLKETYSRCY